MRTSRSPRRARSLAGQLFAMQVVLVAVLVAGCAAFAYVTDRIQAEDAARHRAAAAAQAIAASPSVRAAIRTERPSRLLQPYAEQVRRDTGVTFVTIMDTDGIRWTHPDPERIGGRFVGHTGPAAEGRTFDETYTGTLGPSVRVVTPIRERDGRAAGSEAGAGGGDGGAGRVVGLVSVGIAVDTISEQLRQQVVLLLGVAGAALALGGAGTYVVNARLRRHTHGMNAAELSRMHDYHEAALHAVREGLLMLDGARRVALINDGARELLGLPGERERDVVGRGVDGLGLPPALTGALLDAAPRVDEVHLTAERVIVVNTSPVSGGERRGTVVTLRDHTELQSLAGELDSVRGFAEALRSQAHEAANRLHTVVSLIEMGRTEEAVDFATEELELAQALTDQVVTAVGEPVLAALLLGKAAQANERGTELTLTPDSRLDDDVLPPDLPARELVTVLGNLVDNALDATAARGPARPTDTAVAAPARVAVTVQALCGSGDGSGGAAAAAPAQLLIAVADSGPGVAPGDAEAIFRRGWSTKSGASGAGTSGPAARDGRGLGLALVEQTVRRHGGTVEVARSAYGGAEFTVRLPLPAPVAAAAAPGGSGKA